jgi:hypothetical protein
VTGAGGVRPRCAHGSNVTDKPGGKLLSKKDDLDAPQKELWRLAAKHVVLWDKLRRDDYDFQSWTKDATNDDLLNAGCCYEYARESHKLRCLLVIWELKRKRELTGPVFLKMSERPTTWGIYLFESGWETWLRTFTDELASNKSFADLHQTSRTKVKESLKALDSYSLFPKAVQSPGRHVDYPGSQVVPIHFFWRHYTNKQIGEEMEKLTEKLRPVGEPEPQLRGKGKSSSIKSFLDALSVMRIYKHERNQWKRLKLVNKVCGYKGCVKELRDYNERRKHGHADQPMSNAAKVEMSKARAHALSFFQSIFQGEKPLNY